MRKEVMIYQQGHIQLFKTLQESEIMVCNLLINTGACCADARLHTISTVSAGPEDIKPE